MTAKEKTLGTVWTRASGWCFDARAIRAEWGSYLDSLWASMKQRGRVYSHPDVTLEHLLERIHDDRRLAILADLTSPFGVEGSDFRAFVCYIGEPIPQTGVEAPDVQKQLAYVKPLTDNENSWYPVVSYAFSQNFVDHGFQMTNNHPFFVLDPEGEYVDPNLEGMDSAVRAAMEGHVNRTLGYVREPEPEMELKPEPADYRGIFYQDVSKAMRMAYHYVALEVMDENGFRFFDDSHENTAIFQFLVPIIRERIAELESHIAKGEHKGATAGVENLINAVKLRESLRDVEGRRLDTPGQQNSCIRLIWDVEKLRSIFAMEALVNN